MKMNITKWSNERLYEFLKEVLEYIVYDPKTKAISIHGFYNIKSTDEILEVILNNTDLEERFNKIKHSREFLRNLLFSKILPKLKSKKSFTIKDFNKLIKDYINNKDPIKEYYLLCPVNIKFPPSIKFYKKKTVNGKQLQFYTYFVLRRSKFYNKAISERYPNSLERSSYLWVLIKEKGRDEKYAVNQVVDKLNEFLGIINFALYNNTTTEHWGNRKLAESNISLPPFLFCYDAKKKFKTYYFTTFEKFEKPSHITKDKFIKIDNAFNSLNKLSKQSDLHKIIFDSLKIFQQAITDKNDDTCFLSYWTGLEIMALKNKKISHEHMIKRIKSIFTKIPNLIEFRLLDVKNKRNALIHSSISRINKYDRNFIKSINAFVLKFLINHCNKYNSKTQLEMLYDHGYKDLDEIKEEKKILDYIIKNKKII